jgi:hypothetical protein
MAKPASSRRHLEFNDFGAVVADAERLHHRGYERAGQWDLAQVCDHLAYFIDASVDGAKFRVPWLIKVLFGRAAFRRILSTRSMKEGAFTPQKPLPASGGDEAASLERLKTSIRRFESNAGELQASPFFGHLTREEWRQLHLIHCGHHLGFLLPS